MSAAIGTAFILLGWSQYFNINQGPQSEEKIQPSNDRNKQN